MARLIYTLTLALALTAPAERMAIAATPGFVVTARTQVHRAREGLSNFGRRFASGAALRAVFSSAAYTTVVLNHGAPLAVRIAAAILVPLHAYGVAETAFPDKLKALKQRLTSRARRASSVEAPR